MDKIILIILILPIIGMYNLNTGHYAFSVGVQGFDNGSLIPFTIFNSVIIFFFLFFKKRTQEMSLSSFFSVRKEKLIANYSFYLNLIFCLLILFGFGAYKVFLGMERGEFRASLGSFGFLYYFIIKFWTPALITLAYLCYRSRSSNSWLFYLHFIVVFVIGLSTGFKSTVLFLFLPMIVLNIWKISILKFSKITFFLFFPLIFVPSVIVSDFSAIYDLLNFLFMRATTITADTSWYIWTIKDTISIEYHKAFLSMFGNSFMSAFDINLNKFNDAVIYDFNYMLHDLMGIPLNAVRDGHNIQGSLFLTSILMFGDYYIVGAFFYGLLLSLFYNFLQFLIIKRYVSLFIPFLVFFVFHVLSWLQSGLPTTILHVSIVVSLFSTFLLIKLVFYSSRICYK